MYLSRPRRSLSHRWPGQRAQLCAIHVSGHPPVAVAPRGEFRKQTNCLSVAASPVAVAPSANVLGYVLCICLATRRRRRTEKIARHTWLNFTVHGAPIAHRTTFYNHFSIVPCGGQIVFAHLSPTDPSPPHRGDHRWGNPLISTRQLEVPHHWHQLPNRHQRTNPQRSAAYPMARRGVPHRLG